MANSWQLIINNIKRKDPNLNFKRAFQVRYTITYKSSLTQKKLYKKTNAIFSMYGKNGIIP